MYRLTLTGPTGAVLWQAEGTLARLLGALVRLYWELRRLERGG